MAEPAAPAGGSNQSAAQLLRERMRAGVKRASPEAEAPAEQSPVKKMKSEDGGAVPMVADAASAAAAAGEQPGNVKMEGDVKTEAGVPGAAVKLDDEAAAVMEEGVETEVKTEAGTSADSKEDAAGDDGDEVGCENLRSEKAVVKPGAALLHAACPAFPIWAVYIGCNCRAAVNPQAFALSGCPIAVEQQSWTKRPVYMVTVQLQERIGCTLETCAIQAAEYFALCLCVLKLYQSCRHEVTSLGGGAR